MRWTAIAVGFALGLAGCSEGVDAGGLSVAASPHSPDQGEDGGVVVEALRLSAAGTMLDFRFRVVDPPQAAALLRRGTSRAYAVDRATGARLQVPVPGRVGPLRATGEPKAGRSYFVLFANPGRRVGAGDRVDVVIGDYQARDLVVE